jgi:hypothetical protein
MAAYQITIQEIGSLPNIIANTFPNIGRRMPREFGVLLDRLGKQRRRERRRHCSLKMNPGPEPGSMSRQGTEGHAAHHQSLAGVRMVQTNLN